MFEAVGRGAAGRIDRDEPVGLGVDDRDIDHHRGGIGRDAEVPGDLDGLDRAGVKSAPGPVGAVALVGRGGREVRGVPRSRVTGAHRGERRVRARTTGPGRHHVGELIGRGHGRRASRRRHTDIDRRGTLGRAGSGDGRRAVTGHRRRRRAEIDRGGTGEIGARNGD